MNAFLHDWVLTLILAVPCVAATLLFLVPAERKGLVRALGVGDRVTVTLKMKGDTGPVEALAEVRWSRPFVDLHDLPAGVGLRFIGD